MLCRKVKPQPFRVNTAIQNGYTADVGEIQSQTVKDNLRDGFEPPLLLSGALNLLPTVPANMSGQATISGLEQWDNPGTGLEADDVTTLGIISNYFFTDKVSFEVKGIAPKLIYKEKVKSMHPSQQLHVH